MILPIFKRCKLDGSLSSKTPCPPKFISSNAQPSRSATKDANEITQGASSSSFAVMGLMAVNPQFEQWVTTDLLLLGWLYNSMTPDVVIQLMYFTNAKDLWEATKD